MPICAILIGVLTVFAQDPCVLTPVALDEPSPPAPRRYEFTREEALARLIAKLPGNTTSRAWHFAKIELGREGGEDVVHDLTRYLEQQLLTSGDDAPARNAMEAMKRTRDPAFAPVLMRATGHVLRPLREEALRALASCADDKACERLMKDFVRVDLRTQALIIRVIAQRAPAAAAAGFLRRLIAGDVTADNLPDLRYQVILALEDQPRAEVVRGVYEGNLGLFPGRSGTAVAKQLHAAGGEEGRLALVRALRESKDPEETPAIILALSLRDAAASRAEVERFAVDENSTVRAATAAFLGCIEGNTVKNTLETLASDEAINVRQTALVALRGRSSREIQQIGEEIATATGTRLRTLVDLVAQVGDPVAIPYVAARLAKAEGPARRVFLQALGRSRHPDAVEPLVREFLSEPTPLHPSYDSVTYAAVVLANISEAAPRLFALYDQLTQDEARRSHLLQTLANIAQAGVTEEDLARQRSIYGRFREILFDAKAPVRDRLQILGYLDHDLRLDDAMRLRRMLRDETQDEGFLRQINDFLWEFF